MRTKLILFMLVISWLHVFSQAPVIIQSKFATSGRYNQYTGTLASIASNGGANQIWDFTSVSTAPAGSIYITTRTDTTKFINSFPKSNWVIIGSDGSYNYMINSVDSVVQLGGAQGTQTAIYTNYRKQITFPLSYQGSFSDTYDGFKSGSLTTTYDAYGTLKTSYGNFNNVIRLNTMRNGSLSYSFWTSDPIMVIAEYDPANQSLILRIPQSNTPVKKIQEDQIYISLNDNDLFINSPKPVNDVSIYNLQGKLVAHSKTAIVNISLLKGSYIVKIDIDNQYIIRKFNK